MEGMGLTQEQIVNQEIQNRKVGNKPDVVTPFNTNLISDGYHTFGELYEHRIALFIALCKMDCQFSDTIAHHRRARGFNDTPREKNVWASTKHSDGSEWTDWFLLGMGREKGKQITYHLPARYWSEICEFADILDKAPEFDGHTSADVLERLKQL